MIRSRRSVVLALLLSTLGCRKGDKDTAVADAGVEDLVLADTLLGFRLTLQPGWKKGPLAEQEARGLRVLLDARRSAVGKPFLVAPRIVVTSEPTSADLPEQARARAIDDLKALGEKGDLKILRTASAEHVAGDERAADLELAYEVKAGPELSRSVEQRSLFVLRRLWDGSRAIVTVTATYLSDDQAVIGQELQRIYTGIVLFPSEPANLDGGVAVTGALP